MILVPGPDAVWVQESVDDKAQLWILPFLQDPAGPHSIHPLQ